MLNIFILVECLGLSANNMFSNVQIVLYYYFSSLCLVGLSLCMLMTKAHLMQGTVIVNAGNTDLLQHVRRQQQSIFFTSVPHEMLCIIIYAEVIHSCITCISRLLRARILLVLALLIINLFIKMKIVNFKVTTGTECDLRLKLRGGRRLISVD